MSGQVKPSKTELEDNSVGSHSQLVMLACVADRLTTSLADVVRAAGYRSAHVETIGHMLADFNKVAEPVISGLRYAMRNIPTVNGVQTSNEHIMIPPDLPLAKNIL